MIFRTAVARVPSLVVALGPGLDSVRFTVRTPSTVAPSAIGTSTVRVVCPCPNTTVVVVAV
jgi:hypothetical protein